VIFFVIIIIIIIERILFYSIRDIDILVRKDIILFCSLCFRYEQIIEKTKVLGQRSYALTTNVVMTSAAVTAATLR